MSRKNRKSKNNYRSADKQPAEIEHYDREKVFNYCWSWFSFFNSPAELRTSDKEIRDFWYDCADYASTATGRDFNQFVRDLEAMIAYYAPDEFARLLAETETPRQLSLIA